MAPPPAPDPTPEVNQQEIDQYDLPKSIITKLSKQACPQGVTMQKDVPIAMIKGSTVFVNYLAALAHDVASEKNHKSIQAAHVLEAIRDLGWEDEPELRTKLLNDLKVYRAEINAKKEAKKPRTSTTAAPPPAAAAAAAAAARPPTSKAEAAPASGGVGEMVIEYEANVEEEPYEPEEGEEDDFGEEDVALEEDDGRAGSDDERHPH